MKTVYTAHSKRNYYAKHFVSAYVLRKGEIPLNPFMNWDYFLDDLVERQIVRKANEKLVELSDEVWQFGEISNGCYHELEMAISQNKPIRFFTVGGCEDQIQPIKNLDELVFEAEIAAEIGVEKFRQKLKNYLTKVPSP